MQIAKENFTKLKKYEKIIINLRYYLIEYIRTRVIALNQKKSIYLLETFTIICLKQGIREIK